MPTEPTKLHCLLAKDAILKGGHGVQNCCKTYELIGVVIRRPNIINDLQNILGQVDR